MNVPLPLGYVALGAAKPKPIPPPNLRALRTSNTPRQAKAVWLAQPALKGTTAAHQLWWDQRIPLSSQGPPENLESTRKHR